MVIYGKMLSGARIQKSSITDGIYYMINGHIDDWRNQGINGHIAIRMNRGINGHITFH